MKLEHAEAKNGLGIGTAGGTWDSSCSGRRRDDDYDDGDDYDGDDDVYAQCWSRPAEFMLRGGAAPFGCG